MHLTDVWHDVLLALAVAVLHIYVANVPIASAFFPFPGQHGSYLSNRYSTRKLATSMNVLRLIGGFVIFLFLAPTVAMSVHRYVNYVVSALFVYLSI